LNEKYFLFVVVGFIISTFGIIAYFALESQSEGTINEDTLDFKNINKLNEEVKEKISNSTAMRDLKQFIQQSSDEIKAKINPKEKVSP